MLYYTQSIKHSVGGNSRWNLRHDVEVVQVLLNYHWESNPTFRRAVGERLVEDGRIGANTNNAIRTFQHVVLRWAGDAADGRVDPDGKTWQALNANLDQMTSKDAEGYDHKVHRAVETSLGNSGSYNQTKDLKGDDSKYFRQGKFKDQLGYRKDGRKKTIAAAGCALCSLTMAAKMIGSRTSSWPSGIGPRDLSPRHSNEIFKKAGAFHGYKLIMTKAARSLGMKPEEYGFDPMTGRSLALPTNSLDKINTHLATKRPIALHVDYKGGVTGDHWVLLLRKNGDATYVAVDPMSGREMKFTTSPLGNQRYHTTKVKKKGVLFGVAGNWGKNTKKAQANYIGVRFILLSPTGGGAAVY